MGEKNQQVIDITLALSYVIFLLGSAPFVPSLWFFLEGHFPWHTILPHSLALLFLSAFILTLPRKPFRILVFSVCVGLFFYTMSLLQRPIERIHFIEYGALSFFLIRLLRHFLRAPWRYGMGLLGVFGIGVLDEVIQGILPNRIYDLRDIGINTWAGGLGLVIFACASATRSF